MVEQDNPASIEDAMAWIARLSERKDAVSRLRLERTGEEPMEIGTLSAPISSCSLEKSKTPSGCRGLPITRVKSGLGMLLPLTQCTVSLFASCSV